MARKSRKTKNSGGSQSLFVWPRVLLIIVPLLAAVLILFNSSNGRSVLGVSDSHLLNLSKKEATNSAKSRSYCNRVTSFSAVTICDSSKERSNKAFKTYSYTCEDGTKGSVEQARIEGKCLPLDKAFEMARKACQRKCITPKPTKPPRPTEIEPD